MSKIYIISIRRLQVKRFLSVVIILVACFGIYLVSKAFDIDAEKAASSFLSAFSDTESEVNAGGKLAIIIDDFGQNRKGVKEMMSIDRHLTFAIMPFMRFSEEDAKAAHEKGYEVIVHLPLEANSAPLSWVGPRPILTSMTKDEIMQIIRDAFENVPFAVGANIHMGSKAGNDENVVSSILDIIKEKNLYFVDSRSESRPIAKKIANDIDVLCFERNVFLDGNKQKEYIKKQLVKAGNYALKKGYAIGIGHVGTEGGKVTAEAISEMLPEFDEKNIELVFVSELPK